MINWIIMTIGTKSSKKLFKRNILKHLINFKILSVITIVCSVFLFFGGPGYYSPRSFKYLWDIGHIVFFCALSTLFLLSWSTYKEMSFVRQCVAVVLIAFILGILIEWVQAGGKRTADILDVGRNLIGTLVAISFLAPAKKTVPKKLLRALRLLVILMVIAAVLPFAKAVADEVLARMQFPVLSDFETPLEIDRWSGDSDLSIDHTFSFHGQSSLRAVLNTPLYSGVDLRYFPRN
jgi:VanZ family protein